MPGWALLLISLVAAIHRLLGAQLRDREDRLSAAAQRGPLAPLITAMGMSLLCRHSR